MTGEANEQMLHYSPDPHPPPTSTPSPLCLCLSSCITGITTTRGSGNKRLVEAMRAETDMVRGGVGSRARDRTLWVNRNVNECSTTSQIKIGRSTY